MKAEQEIDYVEWLATIVVNFVSWTVLWPVMFVYRFTIAILKAIFHFWIDFISKLVGKALPEFETGEIQHIIHDTVHQVEETVEPILSHAKSAALRLAAAAFVFTIILFSSVFFYMVVYWMLIPKLS